MSTIFNFPNYFQNIPKTEPALGKHTPSTLKGIGIGALSIGLISQILSQKYHSPKLAVFAKTACILGAVAFGFGGLSSRTQTRAEATIKPSPQSTKWLWNQLDPAVKFSLAKRMYFGHDGMETVMLDDKPVKINWECSGAYGAHAYVFILRINDGEEFAVKKTRDLNFKPLGDSAAALLNHSIQGVVPLLGIDSMVTNKVGEGFHLIAMDRMQHSVHNFKESLRSKSFKECLRWCFSSVETLRNALIELKQLGFEHGDIHPGNLMVKNGNVCFIDIDYLNKYSFLDKFFQKKSDDFAKVMKLLLINVCDESSSERMNIAEELNKWTLDVTSRCPPPSPRSFLPELQSKRDEILRKLDD